MSEAEATAGDLSDEATVAAAMAGDETAFARLVRRYERELHVHCYRMLGSFTDAEDLVQETFLRAWRSRDGFSGGAGFRAWLYRIATNACLDEIRRGSRQVRSLSSLAEVPWLQPYPDRLLDEVAPGEAEPDAAVVARETIELAFLATLQLLPTQQRAALILRDVVGWSAAETARMLETSVAAANSALLRARIAAVNPGLNAVVELRAEAALREAAEADRAMAAGARAPLLGVPITVKESFDVTGLHTTWGNPAITDHLA